MQGLWRVNQFTAQWCGLTKWGLSSGCLEPRLSDSVEEPGSADPVCCESRLTEHVLAGHLCKRAPVSNDWPVTDHCTALHLITDISIGLKDRTYDTSLIGGFVGF